jgi:hypothetical protein
VDVEPKQDFKNQDKYYLREGESSVKYTQKNLLNEKVKENANRR